MAGKMWAVAGLKRGNEVGQGHTITPNTFAPTTWTSAGRHETGRLRMGQLFPGDHRLCGVAARWCLLGNVFFFVIVDEKNEP